MQTIHCISLHFVLPPYTHAHTYILTHPHTHAQAPTLLHHVAYGHAAAF